MFENGRVCLEEVCVSYWILKTRWEYLFFYAAIVFLNDIQVSSQKYPNTRCRALDTYNTPLLEHRMSAFWFCPGFYRFVWCKSSWIPLKIILIWQPPANWCCHALYSCNIVLGPERSFWRSSHSLSLLPLCHFQKVFIFLKLCFPGHLSLLETTFCVITKAVINWQWLESVLLCIYRLNTLQNQSLFHHFFSLNKTCGLLDTLFDLCQRPVVSLDTPFHLWESYRQSACPWLPFQLTPVWFQ